MVILSFIGMVCLVPIGCRKLMWTRFGAGSMLMLSPECLEPISKWILALFFVMPAKAGIHKQLKYLDSGFRWNDKAVYDLTEKIF